MCENFEAIWHMTQLHENYIIEIKFQSNKLIFFISIYFVYETINYPW